MVFDDFYRDCDGVGGSDTELGLQRGVGRAVSVSEV